MLNLIHVLLLLLLLLLFACSCCSNKIVGCRYYTAGWGGDGAVLNAENAEPHACAAAAAAAAACVLLLQQQDRWLPLLHGRLGWRWCSTEHSS